MKRDETMVEEYGTYKCGDIDMSLLSYTVELL